MNSAVVVILCLSFILGLLSTVIAGGGVLVLLLAIGLSLVLPAFGKPGLISRKIWWLTGMIGLLASGYFYLRVPQPQSSDISQFLPKTQSSAPIPVAVVGTIQSPPHLTRSQKVQVWMAVSQLGQATTPNGIVEANKPVTGKLYVTLPATEADRLAPGQQLGVLGSLYLPQSAANPGSFDFKAYLAQEGSFAGLRGCQIFDAHRYLESGGDLSVMTDCNQIDLPKPTAKSRGIWWRVRQTIIQSQQRGLGNPEGALVSAMVLGNKAVDIPFELKDRFTQVGLAAALAASGFQVSLILGVVLGLCRRLPRWLQFTAGILSLLVFVGLAGAQPSVLRAALMGGAGLVGLLLQRKVKPVNSLLLAVTLLLLWNPLWIWDLGFQFSVLATLGLFVTVPTLTKWLDWLPTAIAPLIAVPIAAYLWTLPAQLAAFGVLSPYSIPVNILVTPLISIISIGGMISALAANLWSPAGSFLAGLLFYPTHWLIAGVQLVSQLPGNAFAMGTISPIIVVTLYTLMGLTWLTSWWRRRWWVALFLGVLLTLVPIWQAKVTMYRATVLATAKEPVMLLQQGSQTTLFNSGDAGTVNFTLLPLLQKAGINQINWAVSTSAASQNDWPRLASRIPIKFLYQTSPYQQQADREISPPQTVLPLQQPVQVGSVPLTLIQAKPLVMSFQLRGQTWLWLGRMTAEQQAELAQSGRLPQAKVLWWSGQFLQTDILQAVQPQVAIASSKKIHPKTEAFLRQLSSQTYCTGQDGAIEWTPTRGFQTTLAREEDARTNL